MINLDSKQKEINLQQPPIFIGGMQRSGTSLMRAIVGSHPDVALFQWDLQLWEKYYEKYKDKNLNDFNLAKQLLDEIFADAKVKNCDVKIDKEILKIKLKNESSLNFGVVCRLFLEEYAKTIGKPRWGLKMPHTEFYVKDIFNFYPNAKLLQLIRDPRDVALSFQSYEGWAKRYNPTEHIEKWRKSFHLSQEYEKLYPNSYLTIKYEELVTNPEVTVKKVCDFLELEFQESMVENPNHLGWKGNNSFFENMKKQTTISTQSIGRYKTMLDKKTIFTYDWKLEKELKACNYEINNYSLWEKTSYLTERAAKKISIWLRIYQNKINQTITRIFNKIFNIQTPLIGDLIFFKDIYKGLQDYKNGVEQCPHLQKLKDANIKFATIDPKKYDYNCYILSPGASITRLTEEEKKIMESGFIIGFNSAYFFDIRLDLYFMERTDNSPVSQGIHECMQYKINNKLLAEDSVIIKNPWRPYPDHIVKNAEFSPIDNYKFSPWLLKETMLPKIQPFTKQILEKWELYSIEMVPNSRISSLTTLAYVASKLRFKNIYFIGTDLINSCHFYLIPNCFNSQMNVYANKLPSTIKNIHATLDRKYDVVTFLDCQLKILKQKFPELKYWSPHQASPLSKVFPIQNKLINYSKTTEEDLIKIVDTVKKTQTV